MVGALMGAGGALTANDRSTCGAGLKASLPGWLARTITTPGPVTVSVDSAIVAGPLTISSVTGRFELAEAVRGSGVVPDTGPAIVAKVMLWFCLLVVNVRSTDAGR